MRTGSANYYRGAMEGESEADFVARRADELESLILAEGPDTIAAMIAEPVSAQGVSLCRRRDISRRFRQFWIAAASGYGMMRVICGFGRRGRFWREQDGDAASDDDALKALSSAYVPVSAAIVQGDIADCINDSATEVGVFGHGYTYSGHPLGR